MDGRDRLLFVRRSGIQGGVFGICPVIRAFGIVLSCVGIDPILEGFQHAFTHLIGGLQVFDHGGGIDAVRIFAPPAERSYICCGGI